MRTATRARPRPRRGAGTLMSVRWRSRGASNRRSPSRRKSGAASVATVRIPGSSIEGRGSQHPRDAVRRLSASSRPRLPPTYRQLPTMDALKDWRMAVVLDDDEVLLCEKEDRSDAPRSIRKPSATRWGPRQDRRCRRRQLRRRLEGQVGAAVAERFQVLQRPAEVSGYENLAGCYVVLITKKGARVMRYAPRGTGRWEN